jgi:HPt (histidine-containing phosphotransfer) domain-containing protein
MDEYLTKPLDSRRLCAVVEELAAGRHPVDHAESAEIDGADAVLARVGGDRQLLAEVARLLMEDLPRHLDAIAAAVSDGNVDALRRAAHGLKGAAANFDAELVVDAARELEGIARSSDLERAPAVLDRLRVETDRLLAALRTIAL